MKKQIPDLRVMTQINKSVEKDSADKNQRSCSEKVNRENTTRSHESTIVKLPVIASFAGTTKKAVMAKRPAPPQKPSSCRCNSDVCSSPTSVEKTKPVSKGKDRVCMLQMDAQKLKRSKTEEIKTVIKNSDELSSTDSDTSKRVSRKGEITRESCTKRSKSISKAKQEDLNVESGRVLRKGSKQPSVRSAQEQLEEAGYVTRPDTSKIYKNFQQSKPEEPTSTPASPVKVVARSIDEIIASPQSTSPSPSDQMIKELPESVLGQNYNIKMEAPIEHEEIKTECQVLPSFHQASLALSLDVLQVEGKAIPKIKQDEVQKEQQEEHNTQRSLSLQASNVKDQYYPDIHQLCTASPRFVVPPYLHLVCRVHHTLDRIGDNMLFTAEDMDNKEEEPMYSKYNYLKEQVERKRICHEAVPISEQFQNKQKDGIYFLSCHMSKSPTEDQKLAGYCLKKPQLQLIGEKVSMYPQALKMLWAPAPPKFSAPISSLNEILFPKCERNVIEDDVFEDFFIDDEELEAEQDDSILQDYGLTKGFLRRCQSLPDFPQSESSEALGQR